jgi:hypothetical protein
MDATGSAQDYAILTRRVRVLDGSLRAQLKEPIARNVRGKLETNQRC